MLLILLLMEKCYAGKFSDYYNKQPSSVIENLNIKHVGPEFHIIASSFIGMVGGAIHFYTLTSLEVMIDEVLCCNCSSVEAVAIFFLCPYSAVVVLRVCGSGCYSESGGKYQFAYLETAQSKINLFDLSTITQCAPSSKPTRDEAITFNNGKQNITYSNFSYNYCQNSASVVLRSQNTLNSESRFCTIIKNTVSTNSIINKDTIGTCIFSMCNIIDNTSPSYVIVFKSGGSFFDSILQGNSYQLFSSITGTITINRGWIKHPLPLGIQYSFISVVNTVEETKTYNILHLSTQQCYVILENTFQHHPSPTECYFGNTDSLEKALPGLDRYKEMLIVPIFQAIICF